MNFERDIKSMQSIQGNHKRNSTTGRNMRPCQWILILIPSLLQMLGIVEQIEFYILEGFLKFHFGTSKPPICIVCNDKKLHWRQTEDLD